MSSLCNSTGHSRDSQIHGWQAQKYQFDVVARYPPTRNHLRVITSAQRGFKCKTGSGANSPFDLVEHQPTCANRGTIGLKWRETGSNEIDIYEVWAICFPRKKLQSEGCLTGSVWSGDNYDLFLSRH